MKITSKILALVLALLFILPLGACGDATGSDDTTVATTEAAAATIDFFAEGSDYKIIRPEDMTGEELDAFKNFKNSINARIGFNLTLDTDWDNKTDFTGAHEILVGNTNRPETAEALAKIDGAGHIIAVIGGKLVVAATSAKSLTAAVAYFIDTYLGDDLKPFAEDFIVTGVEETQMTSLSINGVKIQEFSIVVSNVKKFDLPIYTLTRFISRYSGISLSSFAESNTPGGHKIIIGGTKADGSAYGTFETEIWYKDGDLHLGCASATMAQKTIYTLIDQYLSKLGNVEVTIPDDGSSQFFSDKADNWDDADPKNFLSIQERIVRGCYKLQSILEWDHSQGKYFTYENTGYKATIAESRNANRTTNCVIVGNWVMKDAGFYSEGIYNHKYDGTFGYSFSKGSADFFSKYMTVIDVRSEKKSVQQMYKEGRLYPGDIIGFESHNQTILPHFNAFDGGRGDNTEGSTGSKFKRWVGANPYPSMTVGFIFRANDAVEE